MQAKLFLVMISLACLLGVALAAPVEGFPPSPNFQFNAADAKAAARKAALRSAALTPVNGAQPVLGSKIATLAPKNKDPAPPQNIYKFIKKLTKKGQLATVLNILFGKPEKKPKRKTTRKPKRKIMQKTT